MRKRDGSREDGQKNKSNQIKSGLCELIEFVEWWPPVGVNEEVLVKEDELLSVR